MNSICKNILLFSPYIKYVGVIDNYGKLITGLCKNDHMLTLINNSFSHPHLYDKISPAIDYFNSIIAYDYHTVFKSKSYNYLLMEKNAQNLVIFPITNRGDKFICIFSDSDDNITETIEKLLVVMI